MWLDKVIQEFSMSRVEVQCKNAKILQLFKLWKRISSEKRGLKEKVVTDLFTCHGQRIGSRSCGCGFQES